MGSDQYGYPFKDELMPILHNLFQIIEEETMLSNLFYEASIALIPKPKSALKTKDAANVQTNISYDAKIFNTNISKPILTMCLKIIHHDQEAFIPLLQDW